MGRGSWPVEIFPCFERVRLLLGGIITILHMVVCMFPGVCLMVTVLLQCC